MSVLLTYILNILKSLWSDLVTYIFYFYINLKLKMKFSIQSILLERRETNTFKLSNARDLKRNYEKSEFLPLIR